MDISLVLIWFCITPEAIAGRPIALVKYSDKIMIDIKGKIDLLISKSELKRRPIKPRYTSGILAKEAYLLNTPH